jgi:hypothetical protein
MPESCSSFYPNSKATVRDLLSVPNSPSLTLGGMIEDFFPLLVLLSEKSLEPI